MSFVIVDNNEKKLTFYESLSLKISNNLENYIEICRLEDGNVRVRSDRDYRLNNRSIPLRRPSFCPFATLNQNRKIDSLSIDSNYDDSNNNKSVSVACVALLEDEAGEAVLLTRRAPHMRTFPNVWVAPGGHVEINESLEMTALRELNEETGLDLSLNDVSMSLLCAWENAFPTTLHFGMPRYHNLVLYYRVVVRRGGWHKQELPVNIDEVVAYCWLQKRHIGAVVHTFSDPLETGVIETRCGMVDDRSETFECFEVKRVENNLEYNKVRRPLSVLTASVSDIRDLNLLSERVSTGTKFGLYEWLKSGRSL